MRVSIIQYTPDAAELMLFTKNTRLNMSVGLLEQIRKWSPAKKAEELAYMAKTIRSSWEFVHVTFLIEGLSRAAAQQVTRTRNASYAMQSMRVVDASSFGVVKPKFEHGDFQGDLWDAAQAKSFEAYKLMVDRGVAKEDARGILPLATECNLVAQYNLRAFVDLVSARSSLRAQGEYVEMVRQMRGGVEIIWSWTKPFFVSPHAAAIAMLEATAKEIGITTGTGPGWEIAKAIDLLRKDE